MAQTILVVDDDPKAIRLLADRLRLNGYNVLEASNGQEALARVQAEPPDLIVLDLTMPGLNGWQVAHQLKADARYRQIPILMLSSLIEEDGPKGALDAGDFLMGKPFQAEVLLGKIRDLLAAR